MALDLGTGEKLWERRFGSPDFGCATITNDVVFTATYDGVIYGVAASDGRVLGARVCPPA